VRESLQTTSKIIENKPCPKTVKPLPVNWGEKKRLRSGRPKPQLVGGIGPDPAELHKDEGISLVDKQEKTKKKDGSKWQDDHTGWLTSQQRF